MYKEDREIQVECPKCGVEGYQIIFKHYRSVYRGDLECEEEECGHKWEYEYDFEWDYI